MARWIDRSIYHPQPLPSRSWPGVASLGKWWASWRGWFLHRCTSRAMHLGAFPLVPLDISMPWDASTVRVEAHGPITKRCAGVARCPSENGGRRGVAGSYTDARAVRCILGRSPWSRSIFQCPGMHPLFALRPMVQSQSDVLVWLSPRCPEAVHSRKGGG